MIHIKVDRESINFLIAVYLNHCQGSLPDPNESDRPSGQSPLGAMIRMHLNATIALVTELHLWDKPAGIVSLTEANRIVRRNQGPCRHLIQRARALP